MSFELAEILLPHLQPMHGEAAWPSMVAGHQPNDWPGSTAPTSHQQDLVYLSSEKLLSDRDAEEICSFYCFMLVRHV